MALTVGAVKVLEQRRVCPPLGSVPPAVLHLSYFDVALLSFPVQQLCFFDFSGSSQDFRDSHFPLLERSLSLALTLFYPLAGRLVPSTNSYPGDHVIRYSDGDPVSLILAESDADFARLVHNQAKEAKEFQLLVPPPLPGFSDDPEGKQGAPLVAFQVTVFPCFGIAIGLTMNHVVTDGFGRNHFLKSWASIFKAGGDASVVKDLPVFDRTLLGDIEHLKQIHLEQEVARKDRLATCFSESEREEVQLKRVTRSTFLLTRTHIEKLRYQISSATASSANTGRRLSTFTVTCAYAWVCLAKSRDVPKGKTVHFGFPVNCRPRLHPQVPASYFGNCVTIGAIVEVTQAELEGENGLVVASEAIHEAVCGLDEGILKLALPVRRRWRAVQRAEPKERPLLVVGSPRFRVYEIDFGWNRPRKVEIVSIDHDESMSLAETRDEEGGMEIGMAGPEDEMLRFTSFFEEGLQVL
ncbi:phenolic glucoside malonyltransferase 1-like [Aristolochia californica]|uniref:phenolic glucoside malonyltransferase 1-like n=1 Tax=Aristolochia californica TaxID=171875 RepID=UPI0035DE38AA